jgi:molecular chaperone GrpE
VSQAEKGKFKADISQKVIDEALQSVGETAPAEDAEPDALEISAPDDQQIATETSEVEELRSQLSLSQEKGRETMARLQELHEQMLRSAADLDNYRKRAQKEKEQMQKFGAEKILSDFLPVLDNLDRALDHSNTAADFTSLMQGVSMTRKLFEDTLAKHGVRPVPSIGQPFDPHVHEAIQQVERADVPPNQVMSELVPGYTLNDRLLRPALVIVSKAPSAQASELSASMKQNGVDTPETRADGVEEDDVIRGDMLDEQSHRD